MPFIRANITTRKDDVLIIAPVNVDLEGVPESFTYDPNSKKFTENS